MTETLSNPHTSDVAREMRRIRTAFEHGLGDKEDLISYAKEIVTLRQAASPREFEVRSEDALEWMARTQAPLHEALRKYPDAFEALHYLWNNREPSALATRPADTCPTCKSADNINCSDSFHIDLSRPADTSDLPEYEETMKWITSLSADTSEREMVDNPPNQAIVQKAIMANPLYTGGPVEAYGLAGSALKAIAALPVASSRTSLQETQTSHSSSQSASVAEGSLMPFAKWRESIGVVLYNCEKFRAQHAGKVLSAAAFCKIANGWGIKDAEGKPLDEGWITTWFANALMRGFDERSSRSDRSEPLELKCHRCGSEGDLFILCAGCQSPQGSEEANG